MKRYRLTLLNLLPLLLLAGTAPHLYAQDLHVYMTASNEVVAPDDRTTYTLTTTNTGAVDLTDISVAVQLPDHINRFSAPPGMDCSSFCDPNEAATWTIGTLAPGQSQRVFYRIQISGDAPAGTITSSAVASATGVSDASTSLDVEIDNSPLVRLNLAPESGPVVAGEAFTYTLTFGNAGDTNPTDVVLQLPVPAGASFVSASDGGTESGGTVTWNLGVLAIGAGGQVQVTVMPDASLGNGAVLEAVAELDPNVAAEPVARSSTVTPMRADVPLRVEYAVSQTAVEPDGQLTYTLTATNTGPVDLTDVEARVLLPGFINRFSAPPGMDCSSFCDPNEAAAWTVGTLAPGQSRTVFFRMFAAGDAPRGEILRSMLTAASASTGQIVAAQDFAVDPTPLLRLSLAPDPGPAVAGEAFTYTLTVGNIGSSNPSSVVLSMALPEGTSFVSATDGGVLQGGVVVWDIGSRLTIGTGGQAHLTVAIDASLGDGSILQARVELDPGDPNEVTVHSSAVTPVRGGVPLQVEYAVSQTAAAPGGQLTYTLTATNTGPVDLVDVAARVLLPGFINRLSAPPGMDCSSFCDPNEAATWTVGTLAPGQSQSVTFEPTVSSDAPNGEALRSLVVATATGSNEVILERDVLIGNETQLPVGLASFSVKLDGDAVVLSWLTLSEKGNAGFEVQHRRADEAGSWTKLAFIATKAPGGASAEPLSYTYRAEGLGLGRHIFRLRQVDVDGAARLSGTREVEIALAEAFALSSPYPNPFRHTATLTLAVREQQDVRVEVFDLLGRHVAVLHDGPLSAGEVHDLRLKAGRLASGLYLIRVVGEHFTETRRVMLVR